jgi:hypothetical protein
MSTRLPILRLEQQGYVIASNIELKDLVDQLSHAANDHELDESIRAWANKTKNAIKGFVTRRIVPPIVHAQLVKHYDKKLNKAVDAGDDKETIKQYQKKASALKLADPAKWKRQNDARLADPEHHSTIKTTGAYGGSADARRMLRSVKAARADREEKQAGAAAQILRKKAAKAIAIRAAAPTIPGVPQFPPDSSKTSPGGLQPKRPLSSKPGVRSPSSTQVTLSKKAEAPRIAEPAKFTGAIAGGSSKTNPGVRRRT